jgi:hypothetical protein
MSCFVNQLEQLSVINIGNRAPPAKPSRHRRGISASTAPPTIDAMVPSSFVSLTVRPSLLLDRRRGA